ncbi:C-5 cytosine-specific DNA methylase [Trichuris suis]|nr:C-5 cytosine-specific DNA methylase [Trichuris suis]
MFAVIVAGRPVLTEYTQIDSTHLVFPLLNPEGINHVVVFLTGLTPFPENYAGAVYLSFPAAGGERAWLYLGFISNRKPSAIFKVCKLNTAEEKTVQNSLFNTTPSLDNVAQLGISIEQDVVIATQTPVSGVTPSNVEPFVMFSKKMVESLFNFAASFAAKPEAITPSAEETYVPLSVLSRWGKAIVPLINLGCRKLLSVSPASGIVFKIVASYEIDESCCNVYDLNFGAGIVSRRNIEAIGHEELDKVCASLWIMSPPCQPFTRQKEYGRREIGDRRMLPFLNLTNNMTKMRNPPTYVLVENVPEFATSDACSLLKRELINLNFVFKEYFLDSLKFGIPNRRNRFYLIARRCCPSETSLQACGTCRSDAVNTLAFPEVVPKMLSAYVDTTDGVFADSCAIPDSRLLQYVYCTEVVDGSSTNSCCFTKNYGRYIKGTGPVLKCNFEVKIADALERLQRCQTDAEKLDLIKQIRIRLFHPEEIKRLLGFPESFRFPEEFTLRKRYQMLGNSVNVVVLSNLIRRLILSDVL